VFGESVDVGGAVAERRDFDGEGAKEEVETGEEAALLDLAVEVAAGGGEDADVGFQSFLAAEAMEALFLQDAEEFGLEGEVEFGDFLEEEGTAASAFEGAVAAGDGAGESAAFVAEELAFDQYGREGGAVDGEEGLVCAAAVEVDAAGDDLLADAVFPEQEDVGGGRGDPAEEFEYMEHAGIAGDHGAAEAGGGLAGGGGGQRFGGFGGEGESAANETAEFFGVAERLFEVVDGSALQGFDGSGNGAEGSDEDEGGVWPALPEEALDFESVAVRQLKAGEDEGEAAAGSGGARLGEA
jgi:hypothetical protein